jgi:alkyl hydroperoxide reductase subunit AhpC
MTRIGQQFPHVHVSAFIKGSLAYFDFAACRGRWVTFCCVPSLGLVEVTILDRQARAFAQEGALLLAFSPNAKLFHSPWFGQIPSLELILLADPLLRFHDALGITVPKEHSRCRSFLIDPDGILRFDLTHDLNGRGMSALKEMLIAHQGQETPPHDKLNSSITKGALTICNE